MFGIGGWEMLLIAVVALLVFGPKRLPELARTMGKGLAEFRRASTDLRRTFDLDLDPRRTPAPAPETQPPAQAGDQAGDQAVDRASLPPASAEPLVSEAAAALGASQPVQEVSAGADAKPAATAPGDTNDRVG